MGDEDWVRTSVWVARTWHSVLDADWPMVSDECPFPRFRLFRWWPRG